MKTKTFMMALLNVVLVSGTARAQTKVYDLKLLPQNVHWGYYDARVKPVLHIASGDTVRVETMVARGIERLHLASMRCCRSRFSNKFASGGRKPRLLPSCRRS